MANIVVGWPIGAVLRKPTRDRTLGVIDNFLLPAFRGKTLGELTFTVLQNYCVSLDPKLSYQSRDKVRDVLSAILKFAVKGGFLEENPMEGVELVPDPDAGVSKPIITPEEFFQVLNLVAEPYATVVHTVIFAGLRASEWVGLKRKCVGPGWIRVETRCCRGDWERAQIEKLAPHGRRAGVRYRSDSRAR